MTQPKYIVPRPKSDEDYVACGYLKCEAKGCTRFSRLGGFDDGEGIDRKWYCWLHARELGITINLRPESYWGKYKTAD